MTRLGPLTEPTMPGSLCAVAEIAKMAGVGKQRAYELSRREGFPRPVDRLSAGRVWRTSDVRAWLAANPPPQATRRG